MSVQSPSLASARAPVQPQHPQQPPRLDAIVIFGVASGASGTGLYPATSMAFCTSAAPSLTDLTLSRCLAMSASTVAPSSNAVMALVIVLTQWPQVMSPILYEIKTFSFGFDGTDSAPSHNGKVKTPMSGF